ncbi:MAG TPA: peptide chain release factor N(5)-glutamine methyltransferase [Candidatus Anaerotruncus excrementipullorum]|uniref:Release factor glutamine methyltransferase n=1 Tax=Candidatus Anaerotruncus excrementipullorum TaxID=2838465 RepID=A0A9D1WPT4_9FIRM|nr:peptide chain release factor N(5)-glutamine methyltransferase [Candidatus Anaerotruncus excrementipullorum]
MTLQEIWREALAQPGPEEDPFALACLFQKAFGVERARLPLCGGQVPSPAQTEAFSRLRARLAMGEPLQYLVEEWEFYGLPFRVGPGVLIPRPDTETLVECALSLLAGTAAPRVADLCAGSGAIAVAVGHSRPDAQVWALELSEQAFPYLEENIARNGVNNVRAVAADVLRPPELEPLDLVVSNPPYIRRGELEGLERQVQWEPRMALDGGTDGLDFYRALPGIWRPRLKPGGWMAFEVGYDQAQAVGALLEAAGFAQIQLFADPTGILRVVAGRARFAAAG